jgi:hypothetical protein
VNDYFATDRERLPDAPQRSELSEREKFLLLAVV